MRILLIKTIKNIAFIFCFFFLIVVINAFLVHFGIFTVDIFVQAVFRNTDIEMLIIANIASWFALFELLNEKKKAFNAII